MGIFVLIRALAAFNHSPLQTPYIPPKPGIDLIQKYLDDAKRHGAVNIQAVEAIKRLRAGGNGDLQPRLNPLESNEPKLGDFSPGLKSPNEPNP